MENKMLMIVDISSFIFRAYYAIRPLSAPDGRPVNAVFGVFTMLLKLLADFRPSHVLLARDTKEGSFRKKIYPLYKANRGAPPEDLIPQFQIIDQLLALMQIPSVTIADYEADDIIGSAVIQWKNQFNKIYIATGDKDLMQFVGDHVYLLDTKLEKIYGTREVEEKMGVRPDQIVDYLALVGDSSDNIPGVKGIGAKGAAGLLKEYQTIEQCIASKDSFTSKRMKACFENDLENLFLSKKLVQIVVDLNLKTHPHETYYLLSPHPNLLQFLNQLGMKMPQQRLIDVSKQLRPPEALVLVEEDKLAPVKVDEKKSIFPLEIVGPEDAEAIIEKLYDARTLFVLTSYNHQDPYKAQVISVAVSLDGKKSYLFCFSQNSNLDDSETEQLNLPKEEGKNLDEVVLKRLLTQIWETSAEREVATLWSKKDYCYLLLQQINCRAKNFDIVQADYLLDYAVKHDIESMVQRYFSQELPVPNKSETPWTDLSFNTSAAWACDRATYGFQLTNILKTKIKEAKFEEVFFNIDNLLNPILAKMELNGICLNVPFLRELEKEFSSQLQAIEREVSKYCEEPVNLKSPKQVSALLFEKLNFPVLKKTKTFSSTSSEVLEELAAMNVHPVPDLILRYRELDKLLSTYICVLPQLANPKTGRLHTSFHQAVTATGRLSSDRPNLQNIPIRTANGRKIRKGFIACPGKLLFSADYSQVELRLLAHFSQDETMIQSFLENKDIHAETAAEVLGIPLNQVTPEQRSSAKAINFGLMYGQSSFGLAKTLRIGRKEAMDYITHYFKRFSKVKSYLDSLKEVCAEKGYAETLFGRKRFLPDIHSDNRTIKAQAERLAVNTPIQGTAADIIKLAMIHIDQQFQKEKLRSLLLLQVHDELIFEVEEFELDAVTAIVVREMENAAQLSVPLKVETGVGANWFNLK